MQVVGKMNSLSCQRIKKCWNVFTFSVLVFEFLLEIIFYPQMKMTDIELSSLYWNIYLSFCSVLYNGVCYNVLKLSADDVIVSQKGSNGERK